MQVTESGSINIYVPQGSIYMNGTDNINCGNIHVTNVRGMFAITAWIRPENYNSERGIYYKDSISFYIDKNTGLLTLDTKGLTDNAIESTNAIDLNKWSHVAAVYDGATLSLYINGILNKSEVSTGTLTDHSTKALYLGALAAGGTKNLVGKIHDVRLYSGTAISALDIKRIYNGINISNGLVAHWKMDEKTGNRTVDEIFSITGAIVGGIWKDRDIKCWCNRWDEGNWDLIAEVLLDPCDRNYLFDNITPGATSELYNILGEPHYIDSTYTSSNTLILEPIYGYGISSLRERRLIAVKNISDTIVARENFNVKIEGMFL